MNAPARFFDKILTFAGDEIRPEYQQRSIGLILPSVGKLCYT
jgi:type I restriction enzyme M protein